MINTTIETKKDDERERKSVDLFSTKQEVMDEMIKGLPLSSTFRYY